jgi:hypothetical protein
VDRSSSDKPGSEPSNDHEADTQAFGLGRFNMTAAIDCSASGISISLGHYSVLFFALKRGNEREIKQKAAL